MTTYTDSEGNVIRLLETADDVTDDVLADVDSTVDWFPEGEPMPTDEFLDRLCSNPKASGYDVEELDSPAARKIMRRARETRKGA